MPPTSTKKQAKSQTKRAKNALVVDPAPLFDLSPHLYMQFMEPLGATDGSVDASWDYRTNTWRKDLVAVTRKLAPTLIRWGGCFASYYRWREGVGPRNRRRPMHNLLWKGMETNQVGTHEFVDFCRMVRADPLLVINFESDGRMHWARPAKGIDRRGTAAEAAEWVDYCNNPANKQRRRNGSTEPLRVPLWQIGNETSYDRNGFDCETAARKTVRFAKAMRRADPTIKLIGWGDSGWAPRMLEVAGEHLDYIAYHNGYRSTLADSPLNEDDYRKDPDLTWRHLMTGADWAARKLKVMRQQTDGSGAALALTESHYSLPGRNRCNVLASWAAGVAYARIFNLYQRNGDALKIATLADFCGTRWMCNAVILPMPGHKGAYMMPVARVMSLFRRHTGRKAVNVRLCPSDLDVTAARTGKKIYLHVANTRRTRSVGASLGIDGMRIVSGKVFEIAPRAELEVWAGNAEKFAPAAKKLPAAAKWTFPPASVTAIELTAAEPAMLGGE
ncbi:MAG: alpha-L-arabinofuranosidase [Planctomycetes bacterium]|nr:alpha-L-arabinofuranosidase [Planctomycetota bacterium]